MRRFGIEIEAYGLRREEVARRLRAEGINCQDNGYTHHVMSDWKVVTDSSIHGRDAFELVSPPLPLNAEGIDQLRKVLGAITQMDGRGRRAHVNRSCGTHVHIEANDLSAAHIANILKRYANNESTIDKWMAPSRRANNGHYCCSIRRINVRTATTNAIVDSFSNRYYKVNMKSFVKYGTIEFRQHQGSLSFDKLSNWVLFLAQFVEASRPSANVEAASVVEALRGKNKKLVELLQENGPRNAESLARMLESTTKSVQSMVCRLRRQGVAIETYRGYYRLANSEEVVTRAASLWEGVSESVRNFLQGRMEILAAA
jgi:biotin operon repressor